MSIEQPGQTPQPLIRGYRKLSDFVQPPKGPLQETQEIAVIPRMKLPAINMTTGESVVPWVTAWSNKGRTSFIPIYKSRDQTPYTPLPELFSDIETIHLPIAQLAQHPEAEPQANRSISTLISIEKGKPYVEERLSKKQRPQWQFLRTMLSRFFRKASRSPT